MDGEISSLLKDAYDESLVSELLASYSEAKHNYYLGGHRLSAVEGGRFCEAAFRILDFATTGSFTPIGGLLDTGKAIKDLERLSSNSFPKSLRIYIPRALRVVYDIRNSRDAAHLGEGIDPNLQDATLVVSVLDWVLAEFIRLSGGTSADTAQRLVEMLVTRKIPIIQAFGKHRKVLRTDLKASELLLVLLYQVGSEGVPTAQLIQWIPDFMRTNFRRTLRALEAKALVHFNDEAAFITYAGQRVVEAKGLMDWS